MTTLETKEGLFALMEQIAAEREAASPIVENLIASGEPLEDIEIPEGWRTAGMVMELCERAFSRLETNPLQSFWCSKLALALALNFDSEYPSLISAYLRGRSWAEIGYAHRYLNAYDASVSAYKTAEAEFAPESALVHQEICARFARACVLFSADRYEESYALNATTMVAFRESGNRGREMRCTVLEAMIKMMCGDLEAAREKYESVISRIWQWDDLHTFGAAYHALGHLYLRLRRISDAVTAFERAREIFQSLDMPAEVSRADWGLAMVLMEAGEPAKALPLLNRVRNDYLDRHMRSAAAEVGLYIVDSLIASDQVDAAKVLTAQVVREFADAKLSTPTAISALGYLRDLLDNGPDVRIGSKEARKYLKKLRSAAPQLSLPLDDEVD